MIISNEIIINVGQTQTMIVSNLGQADYEPITINSKRVKRVKKFKYLEPHAQDNLKHDEHLKMRKFAAFNASYSLETLGLLYSSIYL